MPVHGDADLTKGEGVTPPGGVEEALLHAMRRYADANPQSLAAHREAAAHMPGGNTRSVLYFAPFPLCFERGEGATLTDVDGHRYDDFLFEYTAAIYGHSHPDILAALHRAASEGVGLGGHNRHEAKLAALLVSRFPAIELVRFTNSGTEANLMALTAARAATGRNRVLVFQGGYHGGVLTFARVNRVNAPYDTILATYNALDETRALIRQNREDLAAILVEPMLQSGGCIPATPEWLAMLREESSAAGALLIFDEVVTSRLHPGGMHGALGIIPDLVTLGKYIGGGLSFGAFGGARAVMNMFDPRDAGFVPHAGTLNNNTLTMAVAHAGLAQIYTPEAARTQHALGATLREDLHAMAAAAKARLQFTGTGSIMGAHMTGAAIACPADAAAGDIALRDLMFFHLLERGSYIARRGMICLSLATDPTQIIRLKEGIADFIETYRPLLSQDTR